MKRGPPAIALAQAFAGQARLPTHACPQGLATRGRRELQPFADRRHGRVSPWSFILAEKEQRAELSLSKLMSFYPILFFLFFRWRYHVSKHGNNVSGNLKRLLLLEL